MKGLKRYSNEILLFILWAILLVVPHFQKSPSIPWLCITFLLFAVLNFIASRSLLLSSYRINYKIFTVFASLILTSLLLTAYGVNLPYLLFSRLGSYSMFLHGRLVVFGDLIHLTSALGCGGTVQVGVIACDPWNRAFNQNSDVIFILRFLPFHSHFVLGIFSLLFFFVTLFLLLRKYAPCSPLIWLMSLTPPMVLAIDRGNEILTIGLISLSIIIWHRNNSSYLFCIPLFLAGVFKLWPFVLLVLVTIFNYRKSYFKSLLPIGIVGVYLISRVSDFRQISHFTQTGSKLGGSFGWMLLKNLDSFSIFAIIMSFICALILIRKTSILNLSQLLKLQDNPWILSLMMAYIFIFFSGTHFTYRLIVLFPLVILINGFDGSRPLQVFIFSLFLTSRLTVVVLSTSVLCLIFSALILNGLRTRYLRV